jgi:hypothetical protein
LFFSSGYQYITSANKQQTKIKRKRTSNMVNEAAEALKAEGNKCLQAKDFSGAIAAYTKAINVSRIKAREDIEKQF